MRRSAADAAGMQAQQLLALLDIAMLDLQRMAYRYFNSPLEAHQLTTETRQRAEKFIFSGENLKQLQDSHELSCWLFGIMHDVAKRKATTGSY